MILWALQGNLQRLDYDIFTVQEVVAKLTARCPQREGLLLKSQPSHVFTIQGTVTKLTNRRLQW
jgi:hypothetical protein